MKKILAIITMVTASAAFAGSGVVMEYSREKGEGADAGKNSNTMSIAPYVKFGNNWTADVKLDTSRDEGQTAGKNKEIKDSLTGRVRKDFKLTNDLKVGLRLGIGERFTQKADYSFYTVEPIAVYNITQDWSVNALYRYRNSFDKSNNYQTDTWKFGTAYKVTQNDEVGIKFTTKYGDSESKGVEFTYSRGF